MSNSRRALVSIAGSLFLTLGSYGAAQATLIPTLGSISPSGGNFLWSYDVSLALDQNATGAPAQSGNPVLLSSGTGDFLTIYDFDGFVTGSCFAPTGWTCQTQALGFTPNTQIPTDSAAVANLTFTRTGATLTGPVADLGDFGAQSTFNAMVAGTFTSRGTRNEGMLAGTKIDSVGQVSVPSPVPEPGTLLLLGSTMAGLGTLLRRRRREQK
jgi:hypothetical protein